MQRIAFDLTIHLSDLLLIGGGIFAFVKVFYKVSRTLENHSREIVELRTDVDTVSEQVDQHHEWIVRSGIDRRLHIRESEERRG